MGTLEVTSAAMAVPILKMGIPPPQSSGLIITKSHTDKRLTLPIPTFQPHSRNKLVLRHIHTNALRKEPRADSSSGRSEFAGWNSILSTQVPIWIELLWRASPAFGDEIAEPAQSPTAIEVVADTEESQFISVLLLAAFIGLSLLTIGVIYLAVTDFLEKREREKMLKQEEVKKKKEKKPKGIKLAKSGPRGFGQRVEEDDD